MSKKNLPLISIIIPNFNGEKFLENCLNSVFTNTKVSFEVLVVEGGSTDQSLKLLQSKFGKRKKIKIIDVKKNLGPSKKRNLGAQQAQGKYLVFLDSDTVVDKDWLIKTISFLEKNQTIGAGQLKILKMNRKEYFDSAGELLSPWGFLAERARDAKDVGQFDKVENIFSGKTAAMIIKKDVFEKAGGFDKDYFMYWEEPDLCWRIWKSGYRIVFLPQGKIWHAYDANFKKISEERLAQITYWGCRNHIMTVFKNGVGLKSISMLVAITISWLILMVLFLIKFDFKRAKAVFAAFAWLVKNLKLVIRKRAGVKKRLGKRFALDREWFGKIKTKRKIGWYLGKGINYILNRPF